MSVSAQTPDVNAARLASIRELKSPKPLGYVIALLRDRSGYLWVGTEGQGLWRYDPTISDAKAWKQFGMKDGLGDDFCYTLAQDFQGRIWVGHAMAGVSVWNGREWANYGVIEDEDRFGGRIGPLGERVFNITVSPSNGDVFLGTSEGLSIYSPRTDDWSYRTRHDGLPSNQIQSLTFDDRDNLFVETQSDGIVKSTLNLDYRSWQPVYVDDEASPDEITPSSRSWQVMRGVDGRPFSATRLELSRSNNLSRRGAFLSSVGWEHFQNRLETPGPNDLSAILSQTHTSPLLEFHGDGLRLKVGSVASTWAPDVKKKQAWRGWNKVLLPLPQTVSSLPTSAKPPSLDDIDTLLKPLSALKTPFAVGSVIYEGDDWRTKGDWVGRYGREYTVLCAARAPLNHYVTLDPAYQVDGFIGPNFKGKDSLRHWVHWVKTENPNTLYNPVVGYRRQSEWDDHGEVYPLDFEGPDVWAKVAVPDGVHRMSLYFFNKDGHDGDNRQRNYALEIKAGAGIEDVKAAHIAPTLTRADVRDFWNGVYKKFIVRGPATYWVKVGRNGSFNTILSAVMLDKIVGPRTWADSMALGYMGRYKYAPPQWDTMTEEGSPQSALVQRARIWEWKIDAALGREGGAALVDGVRMLALRALMAQPPNQVPPRLLERWRWKSAIWNKEDRNSWNRAMSEGREAFFVLNPKARDIK